MGHTSKRIKDVVSTVDLAKKYSFQEAIAILKKWPPAKFNESVEIALKLGADPRRNDQNVRGTVALPHGTGKTIRILVLAKGEKIKEALAAGAVHAGHDDLVAKIAGGWTDFDAVIATPDMMREVGKLGKVLGPRGLMPTPKAGTVTQDITKAIEELQAGKIEFKLDKHAVLNNAVGKVSFSAEQIQENLQAYLDAVQRAKPAAAKGIYMQSLVISSTMGPGIKVQIREAV